MSLGLEMVAVLAVAAEQPGRDAAVNLAVLPSDAADLLLVCLILKPDRSAAGPDVHVIEPDVVAVTNEYCFLAAEPEGEVLKRNVLAMSDEQGAA
jgi:hypothetical protein